MISRPKVNRGKSKHRLLYAFHTYQEDENHLHWEGNGIVTINITLANADPQG